MNTDNNNEKDFLNWEGAPKISGMKVPKGYFDRLETSVLQSISAEETLTETKVIPIPKKSNSKIISIFTAIAAALIGAVLIFNNPATNDITYELAEELLLEEWTNLANIDDYFIAENFTEAELASISFENKDEITAQAAFEYMLDEGYPEYLLYETY